MEQFELVVDFHPDSPEPARIFRSMAGLIDSFELLDHELLDSIDLPLRNDIFLHEVDKGSLKAVLRWVLTLPDKEALRDGDWKKVLGRIIDDARCYFLKKLQDEPNITQKKQLIEIQEGLSQIISGVKTEVLVALPATIPLHRILYAIESFESATRVLSKDDSAIYTSDYRQQGIPKEIVILSQVQEEILQTIPVHEPTRALLPVKKADLIGHSQWDLYVGGKVVRANILDTEWLGSFHAGKVPITSGDALDAMIAVTLLKTAEGELVGNRYDVTKIFDIKKGVRSHQMNLIDESDAADKDAL